MSPKESAHSLALSTCCCCPQVGPHEDDDDADEGHPDAAVDVAFPETGYESYLWSPQNAICCGQQIAKQIAVAVEIIRERDRYSQSVSE